MAESPRAPTLFLWPPTIISHRGSQSNPIALTLDSTERMDRSNCLRLVHLFFISDFILDNQRHDLIVLQSTLQNESLNQPFNNNILLIPLGDYPVRPFAEDDRQPTDSMIHHHLQSSRVFSLASQPRRRAE